MKYRRMYYLYRYSACAKTFAIPFFCLPLFFSAVLTSRAPADEFQKLNDRVSTWLQLRAEIQKAEKTWKQQEKVLEKRIKFLQDQKEALRKEISELKKKNARRRDTLEQRQEQCTTFKTSFASVQDIINKKQQCFNSLCAKLPFRFREENGKNVATETKRQKESLPEENIEEIKQSMDGLLGDLNAFHKKAKSIVVRKKVLKRPSGKKQEMTVMYIGGVTAFARHPSSKATAHLWNARQTNPEWEWTSERYKPVKKALDVYNREKEPTFVRIPLPGLEN